MKTSSKILLFVAGAASGLGAGYVAFKPNADRCEGFYKTELAAIEQKYESIPPTPGVAAPKDMGLEYVVSEGAQFKGLLFTDFGSGKQGVVTKNQIFGSTNYSFVYADVSQVTGAATAKVELPPGIKELVAKK